MEVLSFATQPERRGLPIKSWAASVEDKALQQAHNLSLLPVARKHVALMPDAHAGYGMPIGGVLFTERAVVPYAIGVDIGCGVILVDLEVRADELRSDKDGRFAMALKFVADNVPTGFSGHKLAYKADVALELIDPTDESDLIYIPDGAFDKSLYQLGTLGGGNHFIEYQQDEEGNAFLMLHSGSRGLGKAICDYYHKKALELNERYHSVLPDRELAFLPMDGDYFNGYMRAMRFAMEWAEANRRIMLEHAINAVSNFVPEFSSAHVVADCHHNYAAFEHHYGRDGIVHRKGAVRAREGELVLIPGSMGTTSYLAEGLGNPESFQSCQHGAGRAHTRGDMRRSMTQDALYAEMAERGVALLSGSPATAMEEAPSAYKDVEDVMARSTDLVKAVKRLTPLGVVKG